MPDINTDYTKAGFGGSLQYGDSSALIIVDVCRAYVAPECPLYAGPSAESALDNNVELAELARINNIPVIFTRVEYHNSGVDGGVFFKKVPALRHFLSGHPMAEFMPQLEPKPDDIVVTKQYPSAFFGTSLAATLTALGVNTVMITGYSTSGCVRATALDAMQNGFVPFVIKDACADRAEGPHESNLFDLQAKYAEVIDTKQALSLMRK